MTTEELIEESKESVYRTTLTYFAELYEKAYKEVKDGYND